MSTENALWIDGLKAYAGRPNHVDEKNDLSEEEIIAISMVLNELAPDTGQGRDSNWKVAAKFEGIENRY